MVQDNKTPHLTLLFNSMYNDEYKYNAYQRLQYLHLWQSLQDAGRKYLNYEGSIKYDDEAIGGKKTLLELTEYRDDIAHGYTDTIDESFLGDLQRTVNQLIRSRYFHNSADDS